MDCKKLHGRMRDICEGKSGLPAWKEEAYRELWSRGVPFGLGDLVDRIIRTLTFGLLTPWRGCGCKQRKAKWNRWVLWYRQLKQSEARAL